MRRDLYVGRAWWIVTVHASVHPPKLAYVAMYGLDAEARAITSAHAIRLAVRADVALVRAEIDRWSDRSASRRPIYAFRMDAITAAETLGVVLSEPEPSAHPKIKRKFLGATKKGRPS